MNRSIQEQEELQDRLRRAEWSSMNKDEITKLGKQITFNEKKQGLYIMRASKTILSILQRGFDKIKQGGRVMVLDEKSAEKLYNRLRFEKSDGDTYKIAFHWKKSMYSHFVKIVELLWKPVISTVVPHCGIVFFHSNSTHSILYSDQSVEILWKFLAYLQSVEKMWNFFGNFVVSILWNP